MCSSDLRILAHIERAGWDMVECFVTAPMVPLTLERAREFWGTRMILWGCIPCSIFSPSVSEDDFRGYIRQMFKTLAPGDAVILGAAGVGCIIYFATPPIVSIALRCRIGHEIAELEQRQKDLVTYWGEALNEDAGLSAATTAPSLKHKPVRIPGATR